MRHGAGSHGGEPGGDARRTRHPAPARPRRRGVAFTTWCAPRTASVTGPPPQGDSSRKRGRSSASSATSRARTSASALARRDQHHAGATCGRRAPASRGRRRRGPPGRGRRAPRAARPCPGHAGAPAERTRVGEPDVGDHPDGGAGDRAQRGDVAVGARAHLEHQCLGRGRRGSSVSGTPASLLYEPGLACTWNLGARAAAVRSLVPVFPAEPVMPTTVAPRRRVARRPSEPGERVEGVVDPHDRDAVEPRAARVTSATRRAACERVGHEVVTVALGDERDEARARLEDARVDGERRRARVRVAGTELRPAGGDAICAAVSSTRALRAPHARRPGRRTGACGPAPSGRSRGPCRR